MCRLLASEDAKSFGIVLSISIHFDMHSVEPTSPACRHTLHSICRFRSDCVNSNGFRRIASTLFRCSFLLSSPSQNAIGGKCWKKFPSSQPGDEWLELWFGGRGRHMCHHFGREALSSFSCHLPSMKTKEKKKKLIIEISPRQHNSMGYHQLLVRACQHQFIQRKKKRIKINLVIYGCLGLTSSTLLVDTNDWRPVIFPPLAKVASWQCLILPANVASGT